MKLILLLLISSSLFSCDKKIEIKETKEKKVKKDAINKSCKELKYCKGLTEYEEKCSFDYNKEDCKNFVEFFNKLSTKSTCMRSFDTMAVPAVWVCGEGQGYPTIFTHSTSLLNKLISKFSFAKEFYASEKFREILSGESAEFNQTKSIVIEKEMKGPRTDADKVFTKSNYDKLNSEWEGELLNLSESNRIRLYNFLDIDAPKNQKPYVHINYKMIAKMINEDFDYYGVHKYLRFIARTISSADEQRSEGLGLIYLKHTEHFLFELTLLNIKDKNAVINNLIFGLGSTANLELIKVEKFEELHKSIIKKSQEFNKKNR